MYKRVFEVGTGGTNRRMGSRPQFTKKQAYLKRQAYRRGDDKGAGEKV